jgi:leader peptidase (prepilin peptidase) / N-methyltransferase
MNSPLFGYLSSLLPSVISFGDSSVLTAYHLPFLAASDPPIFYILYSIFLCFLGLCLGSFALVLAYRIMDGRDWVRGHSECESCHHLLSWKDLVPLLSWLSSKGHCRYCKVKLSREYPLIELLTSVFCILSSIFWPYGYTGLGLVLLATWLVMLTILIALVVTDLKWFILPDKLVYTLVLFALLQTVGVFVYKSSVGIDVPSLLLTTYYLLLSVAVSSGFFYLIYKLSKGKYIGFGDIKYGLFSGILLAHPFKSMLVISLGSLIGTLLVIPSMLSKKTTMTSQIPFGPSLIAATVIMYIWGDRIITVLTTTYLFP